MSKQVKAIDPSYLECRDIRHGWEHDGDVVLIEQKGHGVRVFARLLKCARCGCVRRDTYQIGGRVVVRVGTSYLYPEGYQVKGGLKVEEARFMLFDGVTMQVPA